MTFEMEAAFNRDKDIVVSKQITHENEVNKVHLIFSLQKNIEFLKLKHHEMLVTLHSEIERLKRTNNDTILLRLTHLLFKKPSKSGMQLFAIQPKT
uniref:CCDC92 domain-containing protein n=1 Tax=Mesocestoides corti TaxID=53468 RepID=A0A5K3EPV0_MESCO